MPAPETPEPTLDDLLAACDLIEEAGAPPAVLQELRRIVGLGARVAGQLPVLIDAFNPGGIMQHWGASIGDVIADGIPALIEEVRMLRTENEGWNRIAATMQDQPLRHDPTLRYEHERYSLRDRLLRHDPTLRRELDSVVFVPPALLRLIPPGSP
jgi:hypothetical protein